MNPSPGNTCNQKEPHLFKAWYLFPKKKGLDFSKKEVGLHLYVRRVSVMPVCPDLLPSYLGFAKGVVETDALPLNVSREFLQKSHSLTVIGNQIIKKILGAPQTFFGHKPRRLSNLL